MGRQDGANGQELTAEQKAQGIGFLILLGLCGAGYLWCSNSWDEAQEKAAVRQAAEDRELDEKRTRLKAAVCNDDYGGPAEMVLHRLDGKIAYVRDDLWQTFNVDQRAVFAGWVALCLANEDDSIIASGRTGETEAFWYLDHGYVPQ